MRMKFIISLVLLAGSTLLARCGSILKCDADNALEMRIAAGQKLKGALVSASWPRNYPNNICQRWHIKAEENQWVEINTGNTYFLTDWSDKVHFRDMESFKYTSMSGYYFHKNIHAFTSESNNVVVEFLSDYKNNGPGLKLDLKSFPCLEGIVNFTETYKGSQYTLIAQKQVYETSKWLCGNLGGHLAVITSKQEQLFISDMLWDIVESDYATYNDKIWIGLYQKTGNDADLQWVDGTPFVINDPGWKPWSWDQPSNKGSFTLSDDNVNDIVANKWV